MKINNSAVLEDTLSLLIHLALFESEYVTRNGNYKRKFVVEN